MRAAIICLLGLMAAASAPAQTEAMLARELEGRRVVVLVDMPGSSTGIDVWPDTSRPIDYNALGDGLRTYGVSIPNGSTSMITKIKVRKKLVEVQLDGGGYSGSTSGPFINTTVRKSQRERDIEAEMKTADDATKKRLRNELRDLQNARQREEGRLKAEAEQARLLAEAQGRELRARSGSRFNVRFAERVPESAMTPEAILAALEPVMQLEGSAPPPAASAVSAPRPLPPPAAPTAADVGNPMALRKGMSEAEVRTILGEPADRSETSAGGLSIVSAQYLLEGGLVAAKFAEGALVSWTMSSR
jgi:hypothetical protein